MQIKEIRIEAGEALDLISIQIPKPVVCSSISSKLQAHTKQQQQQQQQQQRHQQQQQPEETNKQMADKRFFFH